MKTFLLLSLAAIALPACFAQAPIREYVTADTYTRYELLAPESNSFYIVYEVTETRPGAKYHFNQIRPGSEASEESVTDRATGKPLPFGVVSGKAAKEDGSAGNERLVDDSSYIRVKLAHPVPEKGEARILIKKTYKDKASYFADGDRITFTRSLGIPKNAIVLPVGYELVSANIPVQVMTEADGRVSTSFLAITPQATDVRIVARKSAVPLTAAASRGQERAHQDREILYELQDPETHAFKIVHDYTESRAGTKAYLNIVRQGSHVKDPSSIDLDTGESLKYEVISGAKAKERQVGSERELSQLKDDDEVVVTWYAAPIAAGGSTRVRLMETYVDAKSYSSSDNEITFDRTFGRARNLIALPPGYKLTEALSPVIVSTLADGRVLLTYLNPRNDEVRAFFKARLAKKP
jgi:hypothetical protein